MAYTNILYPDADRARLNTQAPAYFKDLNLHRIVDAITAGRKEFDLKPLFYTPLLSEREIVYRQGIIRDLFERELFESVKASAKSICTIDIGLTALLKNAAQENAPEWSYLEKGELLEFAYTYCGCVDTLTQSLSTRSFQSDGLVSFQEYLIAYTRSDAYVVLHEAAFSLKRELSTVQYCMLVKDGVIKIRKYDNEQDYTPEIENIFDRFRQAEAEDYTQKVPDEPYVKHIEAQVLQLVSRMYPALFLKLDQFCNAHRAFMNQDLSAFARDVQFYISYLEYIAAFEQAGLGFCFPSICKAQQGAYADKMFDIALAQELMVQGRPVVCNDFSLKAHERVIVVTGPNQGGKTTFARVFGQLHYLMMLGCCVPAVQARLMLPDQIFTHFEREENLLNLSGKLQDDLIRIREILSQATGKSLIIINEILASTTLQDAVFIGKKLMDRILALGSACVCVTFLDELAAYDEAIVSMVGTVAENDERERTFRIVRGQADGLAYAAHIAQRYGLTYQSIKERIQA